MVLFNRYSVKSRLLNRVHHSTVIWKTPTKGYMFVVSWAVDKGDWWKSKEEDEVKFLRFNWKKKSGEFVRSGIYIGRLAIVFQER